MPTPISRKDAMTKGLLRYVTGRPCKRGHFAERWVSTCMCVECLNVHNSKWKKAHRAKCSEQKRKWSERNREKVRALKRSYYEQGATVRELQAKRARKWLEANREKSRAASARWRRANLPKAAAAAQRRRAKLLKCLPAWADHVKIQKFYLQAQELTEATGIPHEVDHIFPLQGELVSGLHIETNLRVVSRSENRSKGARFPGTERMKGTIRNGLFFD